ncbi:MAG: helix-turn-helix transcriptional regulator [Synergistaceae bacterium]|nr:helix-turn-helix transcriptional regulator [Synergistaceae bacterium]
MIKSRVKVMLALREMTQLDLVARTGIRQPTVSALCTGKAKHIPIDVLDKMCEVLNCQPSDLFEFIHNPPDTEKAPGA